LRHPLDKALAVGWPLIGVVRQGLSRLGENALIQWRDAGAMAQGPAHDADHLGDDELVQAVGRFPFPLPDAGRQIVQVREFISHGSFSVSFLSTEGKTDDR